MQDGARQTRARLAVVGLAAAALATAALLTGIGHSVLLAAGQLGEDRLSITRGRWDLVAGSAVVFVAFVALIPVRLKRDWRSHGIYAAFVIALFAEMFGFPLTAYFLSTALGLTSYEPRFMLYMYRIGMPVGSVMTLAGIVLVVLGWRDIYRARGKLVTTGVYRYVRHPQYLGILLVTAGWLVHWPTLPGLAMWPALVVLYYRLARREEAELVREFGDLYRTYASRTPMLVPVRVQGLGTVTSQSG
ncbi:MAG: isoprenylcysteine carboxylmethyltransferase family protein [Armatimonadota bacterium]|nr:isoprenylcysteine carboxylmethyltransferase family protein [Armatimonadota bacterium]MDR7402921.1 isoprenylcysteine carboxylmethyltransferase family protein [Armatimonadota bacterium]MDR7404976.1 isoprenylcysteine carboxylmethyltransferase family protein [Armatimonadota bacterium]MDR7437984.1 isoprenylcysteine carboxylmethyltransferase family protein [Armatimonadota bacterium]MDR7473066.1 isoprenylcysteine carboxylmethyltransferase family protein [Armatimonadota bacterium]